MANEVWHMFAAAAALQDPGNSINSEHVLQLLAPTSIIHLIAHA